MKSSFTHTFFEGNRKRLRTLVPRSYPIVVSGHGLLQRSNDTAFPFQQNSNFWYLTGLTEPDLILVIAADDEFIISPARSAVRAVFDGTVDDGSLTMRSGIKTILDDASGWERLKALLQKHEHAYIAQPASSYDENHGIYANPAPARVATRLKRSSRAVRLLDVRPQLASLRSLKQTAEIDALERAITTTTQTIDEIRKSDVLTSFTYEYELEAAISARFRAQGASGHGYSPIIAGGQNATTLHYVENADRLRAGDLIVVDVGAEVEHYSADITRTLTMLHLTPRQQAVLYEVRAVQLFALETLRPGVLVHEYERAVHVRMGKSLKKLKLITSEADREQIWQYYPHGTSHFLGLDVHDVGDYRAPLQAGMTLTCEPGIYIPEEGIGVRLEDDVLITSSGHRVLGDVCSHDAYTV